MTEISCVTDLQIFVVSKIAVIISNIKDVYREKVSIFVHDFLNCNLTKTIMAMNKMKMMAVAVLSAGSLALSAQQLAFPGAQGWGRFAVGGRTGTVYHVTNLNDSGTGSLRDAVSQANRIIVFDVAGVINLQSRLVFKNNLYVAGQTAPGEGVIVYGNGVSFSGSSNIIVRHMRFRMGHKGDSGKDCAGISNGANMIFDHCSFAWGLDETFSINPDGKGVTPQNITLQNCIVGQGLMTHSAGGLMQTDSVSLIGNFLCDNNTRNFKIKGINQYANNMVYNWSNGAYIMGGDSEGKSYVNIQSNLFINGPAKGGAAFTGGNADFHCYGVDNWQDNNMDGVFNPFEITDYNAATRESTPYDYPALTLNPGKTLLDTNLPTVGASLPYRDMTDCYMVDEILSYGKQGALISNEESLVYGAPSTWKVYSGVKKQDTDGDGMPDAWETANGTNPNLNDAMKMAANGYVNIENYINSITVDDRDFFLRTPVGLVLEKATTQTLTIAWRDYTYAENGFAVEIDKGNGYEEAGRTAEGATSFTISGLLPATTYKVRVRAFANDNKYSEYTEELSMDTRMVEQGIIDVDSYEADVVNAIETDKNVLIDSPTDLTLTLTEPISPTAVVVNSPAHITIDGVVAGTGSMNKAGEGVLTLNSLNTYTGATVLHEGILEFNTLKDGGVASSLGAGIKDAQNWIMDGGVYKYTGGTTSTNRGARLLRETELNIDKSGIVVTANGSFEGTGDFAVGGAGQLTIGTTGFFKYTGNTILRGGSLYLSTTDIAKAGIGSSKKLVMAGGHLKTKGESSGYETYSFPIEVEEGTTSQFSPNRNCYMNNKVSGAGTIQLNIPYLREYVQGDWSGFTGRLIANGTNTKDGSLMLLDKTPKLENTVIDLRGNARMCYWSTNGNLTIGGLAGVSGTTLSGSSKQTNNFTCTWTVGSANTDETFRGSINNWSCSGSGHVGTVNIVKTGTGLWRLTGTSDYKGTTVINDGRLVVNGTLSGTGAVTVNSGATLAGTGTLAGMVTVKSGATIVSGDTLVTGTQLKLNGGLTVAKDGVVEIPLYYKNSLARANSIKGSLTINDATLVINLEQATNIPDNQKFTVFSGSRTGTGFVKIEPERPSETQVWDTSELMSNGYLYVRNASSSGIDKVSNASAADAPKYNLQGQRAEGETKGLFIQNGKIVVMK